MPSDPIMALIITLKENKSNIGVRCERSVNDKRLNESICVNVEGRTFNNQDLVLIYKNTTNYEQEVTGSLR